MPRTPFPPPQATPLDAMFGTIKLVHADFNPTIILQQELNCPLKNCLKIVSYLNFMMQLFRMLLPINY